MAKIKDGFRGSRAIVFPQSIINEIEKDPFGSKLYITDIGYYPLANHHYRKRGKGIPQYILIYCINGRGWVEILGRHHNISANQFIIIPKNAPHAYGACQGDPWTIYWLHFNGEMAPFYSETCNIPTYIEPSDQSRIADRISVFEEIYLTLQNGYGKENLSYAFSCLYYFLGSVRHIGKFRESAGKTENTKDLVERAVSYMLENTEKKISLKELCSYLGYSASYLSATFKRHTGYSPIEYTTQLKMQTACRMLDFTDMRINQICYKLGIPDPYHFSKLFTKTTGYSPTMYRNMKKG